MLRVPLRLHVRHLSVPAPRANTRSFVSSVLLSRNWESDTVAELKQEAKKRGLPVKGTKATLISRIQEHDQRTAHSFAAPESPAQTREASTAAVPQAPPPQAPPAVFSKQTLDIKLPDLSAPPPEQEVQIPFTPDFWESSRVKKVLAPEPVEPITPKLIVVGGESTYPGGSPSHNLLPAVEHLGAESAPSASSGPTGLWGDIAEDIGLPTKVELASVKEAQKALLDGLIPETTTSTGQGKSHERTLDREEVRGVYVILGVLTGSWLLAGALKKKSAFAEHAEDTHAASA
ncbi:hypothetical protein FA95DRAFT_1551941 [Auriscalpium vulgare]|uniref:Uncharacterized protein n=1 Tax=Auriscalpium vulgare TaxID=40419 RepID=A0ACB8SCC1_9AGAM|nr:hypothetical protein FA95DRAFT_1551941 [Auriscalpium vulgare]